MKLNKDELLKIKGGTISSTMVNAIVKGISLLIDLGKSFGTTIRRISANKTCDV